MKKDVGRNVLGTLILFVFFFAAESCGPEGGGKNHHPRILSAPSTTAVADEPYVYVVKAVDRDHDLLNYRLRSSPEGMSINPKTGEINWMPKVRQVGNHVIEVVVTDGEKSASQVFAVRVIPLDNGVPFQRGIDFLAWQNDAYLQPRSDESLRQIRADGVEWVSILVTWYVDDPSSTTIYPVPWTPTDEAIVHAIQTAQSLGMHVAFKPHIDPINGEWRGNINFGEDEAAWATWFTNYDDFLGHYLDLAEANHVDMVIIGTELAATELREADWRNTIALARTRYSGLMTYGANHTSYFLVGWWDALDFIGISAYFPLTDIKDPTVEELKAAWEINKRFIRSVAAFFDRDVVFTEIGYLSRDGTNREPWNWRLNSLPDLQEQADCYQACLETFYNEPWFKGMYWWGWSWDPEVDDNGMDVYNKPAEDVLRQWYAGY